MEEYTIYCVQSGLGKTWVCQHYPGWYDLDWHPYKILDDDTAVKVYTEVFFHQLFYNYKMVTTLQFELIERLLKHPLRKYKVVLVLAEPNRKEEIIGNIAKRSQDDGWAKQYAEVWDHNQVYYRQFIRKWHDRNLEYVYLQKGEFFEDFLKKRGVI